MSARADAEWARRPERGNLPVIRFMAWLSLAIGRTASRVLLRLIAAYFLATGGAARRNARAFLERTLGRAPTLAEQYRHFFSFASVIHDRLYFLRGRFDLFEIEVRGAAAVPEDGALLMGGHVGSFEVLRAHGTSLGRRHVVMAMYEENARQLNRILGALNPDAAREIVALGRPQAMLDLAARLDEGAIVGVLADRTLGDEPMVRLPFLGADAPFPTGPMRMAAALHRPVVFMAGLYRGGNRYEIRFEPLADFSGAESMSRAERDAAIRAGVAEYARQLERCAREAPFNWFNFHDFWGDTK